MQQPTCQEFAGNLQAVRDCSTTTREAFGWVHWTASVLGAEGALKATVRGGLLGAMRKHRAAVGDLAGAMDQFLKVTRSYFLGDRYKGIDFGMPHAAWTLDNASVLNELVHLGERKAQEEYLSVKEQFLTGPAERYVPFTE